MIEGGNINYSEIARHAFIAFFAGVAHALNEKTYMEKKNIYAKFGEFVASTLVASFSGVIFGFLAIAYFGENSYIALAITGSGGFMGAKGMKMLSRGVLKIIKVSLDKKS